MATYSALSPQPSYHPDFEAIEMVKPVMKSGYRDVEAADFPYDRALRTRNFCIMALVFCWLAGFALVGLGGFMLYVILSNKVPGSWFVPHMAAEAIPLSINLLVTLMVETTGYIHTASLRWALQREGRLTFNSNLRLCSFSKHSRPNKWYSNFLVLVFITLAYASSSMIFWHSHHAITLGDVFDTEDDAVSFGAYPIIVLGICFIGLAAVSTWALRATEIPSWSSSPMDTALAALRAGNVQRRPGRCLRSVHETHLSNPGPAYPRARQEGAWAAHWEVKWVLILLWVLVALCFAWAGIISHLIAQLVDSTSGFGGWSLVPTVDSSNLSYLPVAGNRTLNDFAIIVLFAILQAPLTFGLHCAELQMNLSRDEAYWRKASSRKGCRLEEYDSIKAAFTSWRSLTLSFFKTTLHWVFGLGVQVLDGRIYFGPAQIVYLALFASLCAAYVTYVSARRPKGPQPAAYGHLQTLVDLVDEWEAVLYWGHKSAGTQTCHAGTAGRWLGPVIHAPYAGVSANPLMPSGSAFADIDISEKQL